MVRADERLKKEFPQITLPVLILHGTADKATKPSGSQIFYRDDRIDATRRSSSTRGTSDDLLNDRGQGAR